MIYRKEEFIEESEQDQKYPVKRIETLTPLDGGKKVYTGHVVLGLQTPVGVQQISVAFDIPVDGVREAFQKFGEAAEPRIEEVRKSIEQEIGRMRQEAQSRIVTPGQAGFGGGNIVDFNKLKE